MPDITTAPLILVLVAVFGYLLGSVPFGIVVARIFGLGDLRKVGSGNIGATNVLRTGNKFAAGLTLVLDSGKGAFAVLIARLLAGEDAAQLAGLSAFLGHLYPVWIGFKGGKGVATFLGTLIALAPGLGFFVCGVWLATAFVFRYSSLSALAAAAAAPIAAWTISFASFQSLTLLCIVLAAMVWIRHHSNISRLLKGEEPKIGRS